MEGMGATPQEIEEACLAARRYVLWRFASHPWAEDAAQQATIGVLRAAELYDPSQGASFLTFAKRGGWMKACRLAEYEMAHASGRTHTEQTCREERSDGTRRPARRKWVEDLPDVGDSDYGGPQAALEASEVLAALMGAGHHIADSSTSTGKGIVWAWVWAIRYGETDGVINHGRDRIKDPVSTRIAKCHGVTQSLVNEYRRRLRAEVRKRLAQES